MYEWIMYVTITNSAIITQHTLSSLAKMWYTLLGLIELEYILLVSNQVSFVSVVLAKRSVIIDNTVSYAFEGVGIFANLIPDD